MTRHARVRIPRGELNADDSAERVATRSMAAQVIEETGHEVVNNRAEVRQAQGVRNRLVKTVMAKINEAGVWRKPQ